MVKVLLNLILIGVVSIGLSQQKEIQHTSACENASENQKKLEVSSEHPYARELQEIENRLKSRAKYRLNATNPKYIIPVVFHIVDQNPDKVTDGQIASAMKILNDDFQAVNSEVVNNEISTFFADKIGILDLEFRLAKLDPSGNITTGINRVKADGICNNTSGGNGQMANNCPVKVTAPAWNTNNYLNIWIINDVYGGTTSEQTSSGWAFTSSSVPNIDEGEDGIVYNHQFLGTEGSSTAVNFLGDIKRVLTHEVGHYFNLHHTHSGWCGDNDNDFVEDTPPVKYNNCGHCCPGDVNNPSEYYLSCDGKTPIAVQSFMAYSGCTGMFTTGQAQRMEASLLSSVRKNLHATSNLLATGVIDQVTELTSGEPQDNYFVAYPNPTNDLVSLSFYAKGVVVIQVKNELGSLVMSNQLQVSGDTEYHVNLSEQNAGVYFVTLVINEEITQTKMIIKN